MVQQSGMRCSWVCGADRAANEDSRSSVKNKNVLAPELGSAMQREPGWYEMWQITGSLSSAIPDRAK